MATRKCYDAWNSGTNTIKYVTFTPRNTLCVQEDFPDDLITINFGKNETEELYLFLKEIFENEANRGKQ